MTDLIHGFRISKFPLEAGRLVYAEAAPAQQEVKAEQVDKANYNVDLPQDLENDINQKADKKVDELNTALTDLFNSVGNEPKLKKVASDITKDIAKEANGKLKTIKDNFQSEIKRVGTLNKDKFEQAREKFQTSVDEFVAKLKAKTDKTKEKYDTEPEQQFELAKLDLKEAKSVIEKNTIKEKMLDSLTGLDEWSQAKSGSVKDALRPFVMARMGEAIWNSENRDAFEAKTKQLFSQPDFWRNVLGDYQKEEPKISVDGNEVNFIQSTIKGKPDLVGTIGEGDLNKVSSAIAKQLNIVFGKGADGKPMVLGYINMEGGDRNLVTGSNCEKDLKDLIESIVTDKIIGNKKSDNPTQDYIGKMDQLEAKDKQGRADFQDTIGNYMNAFGSLDELATVMDRSKGYREFAKAQPIIEQFTAVAQSIPPDATPEMRDTVASLANQTPEQINSNPYLREGSILAQIVELIKTLMGKKDTAAVAEVKSGVDRKENVPEELKKAKAEYERILNAKNPAATVEQMVTAYLDPDSTKLFEESNQKAETKDLLNNYKSFKKEVLQAALETRLGIKIQKIEAIKDVQKIVFKKSDKPGEEELTIQVKKEGADLMAQLESDGKPVGDKFKLEDKGAKDKLTKAPAKKELTEMAQKKDTEGKESARIKSALDGLVSDPNSLMNIVKAMQASNKDLKDAPDYSKFKPKDAKSKQVEVNQARIAWIMQPENYPKFKQLADNAKEPKELLAILAQFKTAEAAPTVAASKPVEKPAEETDAEKLIKEMQSELQQFQTDSLNLLYAENKPDSPEFQKKKKKLMERGVGLEEKYEKLAKEQIGKIEKQPGTRTDEEKAAINFFKAILDKSPGTKGNGYNERFAKAAAEYIKAASAAKEAKRQS